MLVTSNAGGAAALCSERTSLEADSSLLSRAFLGFPGGLEHAFLGKDVLLLRDEGGSDSALHYILYST